MSGRLFEVCQKFPEKRRENYFQFHNLRNHIKITYYCKNDISFKYYMIQGFHIDIKHSNKTIG